MKSGSSWRSVRFEPAALPRVLRSRHRLWLHGWCIGLLVLGVVWAAAHLQLVFGSESLAARYALSLGVGYATYLLILRIWAALLRDEDGSCANHGFDLPGPGGGPSGSPSSGGTADATSVRMPSARPDFSSGGGGDYAGGGASASFDGPSDAGGMVPGALEVAGSADEGAVIVVPVVAVFLVGVAVLFGAGGLLLLLFGSEVLLAVAIELAFSYVAARTVMRIEREGWLLAAVRLTWKPLLGTLACAVLLGLTIDLLLPTARSPDAIRLITAG